MSGTMMILLFTEWYMYMYTLSYFNTELALARGLCNLFLEMITISIAHIFPLKDYWIDHKDEENSPSFFVCIVTWQHFVQFLRVAGSFDRTINWLELDHKYISHVSFYRGINHNMYFFLKKYRRKYSGYVSTRIRQY